MTGHAVVNSRITQDTGSLYWLGLEGDAQNGYSIQRVAKAGGAVSTLASMSQHPDAGFIQQEPIAGGFGSVFFSTTTGSGASHVFAASVGGPAREILATPDPIFALAVEDAGLYASGSTEGGPAILALPVDGGAPVTLYSPSAGVASGDGLAVNGSDFAWIEGLNDPIGSAQIATGTLDVGSPVRVVANIADGGAVSGLTNGLLATDGQYVYWMLGPPMSGLGRALIMRTPLGGGASQVVVDDEGISSYTIDGEDLYWSATHADGQGRYVFSQAKTPKSGGAPTLIACIEGAGIAVDPDAIYVAGGYGIWRIAP
jgi:hypothetical protein